MWRMGIMGTDRMTLMIGMNMAEYYKDLDHYRFAVLAIIPLSLDFLAAGGWIITNRALKPVSAITRTAEQITVQALHRRIPPMRTDSELGRLVEVINRMLDRLEKSFGQAARFSADAAHELQTPLTILMGELEDALQHAPMGSIEQERYTGLLEEVERLRSITRKLLILARADAGKLELHRELVDLSAMVHDAVEDVQAIAPHLRIEHDIAPGIAVMADRALLEQAILNLTTNAVKYNSENGLVRFLLSVDGPRARIIISNTGDPIPDDEREKIFGRFYRIDPSRSRNISGSGLGLSLALEIARAHSGDLRLSPLSEDDMISFILLLPLKPAV
jgi:signal transduction histidine kinase